ncbi:hypothetical protein [Streptomyces sp. NPDC002851]
MSFLKFAFDEVNEMARTLETSGGRMKNASKGMSQTDSNEIGHEALRSACNDFADSWDYGFGQLSKMTKDVSKFSKKAAEEFEKLDRQLYEQLTKAGKKDG